MKKVIGTFIILTTISFNIMAQQKNAKAAFQREMIFPIGEPNTAYAKYFKGNSYLAKISDSQIPFFNVTFEPGCRNNWHTHHATKGGGQMLLFYQIFRRIGQD